MVNKNIVLFSSGVTEKNGILRILKTKLEEKGYICSYWKDLFAKSYDSGNIALLPMLIKKIPTFDYAILVCEGNDITTMMRDGKQIKVKTMRDNVLFEIGLCTMALGVMRTILVTDSKVHLPDDLKGINGELAVKQFMYNYKYDSQISTNGIMDYAEQIAHTSDQIDKYIKKTGSILTPAIISAASSTACSYVNNFIFQTLEWIDCGIVTLDNKKRKCIFEIEKIYFHIILPQNFTQGTIERANKRQRELMKGKICKTRNRDIILGYKVIDDELHIIDYPSIIGTSYDTAKMILSIEANDYDDMDAQRRFILKEINIFEATIKSLLSYKFLKQTLDENYDNETEEVRCQIFEKVYDIISNRLIIERIDY